VRLIAGAILLINSISMNGVENHGPTHSRCARARQSVDSVPYSRQRLWSMLDRSSYGPPLCTRTLFGRRALLCALGMTAIPASPQLRTAFMVWASRFIPSQPQSLNFRFHFPAHAPLDGKILAILDGVLLLTSRCSEMSDLDVVRARRSVGHGVISPG
jgi:hypothetical protein